MAKSPVISPEALRNLLDYDPDTGALTWRLRSADLFKSPAHAARWNGKNAGKLAFTCIHPHGYKIGAVMGVTMQSHRVIWALAFGVWPEADIDHINGIRGDNRLVNLRAVTRSENGKNQKIHTTNKSGASGVSWCRRQRAWAARITVDGRRKHIGYFAAKDIAIRARQRAEVEMGFHPNHGKRA